MTTLHFKLLSDKFKEKNHQLCDFKIVQSKCPNRLNRVKNVEISEFVAEQFKKSDFFVIGGHKF